MSTPARQSADDPGMGLFFIGIAILAGTTGVSLALWLIFGQRITFVFLLPAALGILCTAGGILVGVFGAVNWLHCFFRLIIVAVVSVVTLRACLYVYVDVLNYPSNSLILRPLVTFFTRILPL